MSFICKAALPIFRCRLIGKQSERASFSTLKPAPTNDDTYPVGWDTARPFHDIPGPSKLQMIRWLVPGGPLHSPDMMRLQRLIRDEFGTLAKLPGMLGKPDMIFTSDPRHFEIIYATQSNWPLRRSFGTFVHFCKKVRPEVFKGMLGLLNDEGDSWYELRKEVNPLMMSLKTIRAYIPAVDEIACEFVERMGQMRDENGEMPGTFMEDLGGWSLETVGLIALDRRLGVIKSDRGEDVNRFIQAVRDFTRLSLIVETKPPIWRYYKTKPFRDLIATLEILTNSISMYIEEAKAAKEAQKLHEGDNPKNVQLSLLQALLAKDPLYAFLTVFDILLAGVDTTSAAIGTLLYRLAINPQQQEILREEVFRLLPEKTSELNMENFSEFRYFQACLKESMRLQPQVPRNFRTTLNNLILDGYRIPKNTDITMCNYLLTTSDEYFVKSAEFLPERWLREDAHSKSELGAANPFAYLPFGFGLRACIGRRLAEMELLILTARILREYRIEWHHPPMKFVSSMIVTPGSQLKFKLVKL